MLKQLILIYTTCFYGSYATLFLSAPQIFPSTITHPSIISSVLTRVPEFVKCDYRESFMSCSSRCKSVKAIGEHAFFLGPRSRWKRAHSHSTLTSSVLHSRNLPRSALIYCPLVQSHNVEKQFAG